MRDATQGRFGVKVVGSNTGGAAIYASSKSSGQSYPISANSYAGFFDGGVHVNGAVYCGDILSNNYGTEWTLGSDGTYTYRKGVSGTFRWSVKNDFLTNNYTLEVVNGERRKQEMGLHQYDIGFGIHTGYRIQPVISVV